MSETTNLNISNAVNEYTSRHPEIKSSMSAVMSIQLQAANFFTYNKNPDNNELSQICRDIKDSFDESVKEAAENEVISLTDKIVESVDEFKDKIENFQDGFFKSIFKFDGSFIDKVLEWFKKIGMLDDESIEEMKWFYDSEEMKNPLIGVTLIISLLMTYLQATSNIIGGDFAKRLNSVYTPNTPDANTAILGMRIAPEKYQDYFKIMKQNGFSEDDITNMIIANYSLQDPTTIQTLLWRKEITPEKAAEKLSEHGFTPERIAEILSTWSVIPSISDILYMLAKEAFEPDQISELGLGAEFPEEAVQWAEAQGLSREWLQKYWYAHWEIPSIQMGYEMLHRRVIDGRQLDSLFRAQEVPPFWRDKLKAISYNPYTRVDIRRMYDEGVVSEDEVYETYLDLGYDEEHARKMTEWTIKYVEPNEKALTMSQIKKGYKDDILTRSEASRFLLDIGYTEDSSNFILDYIDYEEQQAIIDTKVKAVKTGFINFTFTEEEARATLSTVNISRDKIDYLISLWKISKEINETLASKTDIKAFYLGGVIDVNKSIELLKKLGYSDEIIMNFIDLWETENESAKNE